MLSVSRQHHNNNIAAAQTMQSHFRQQQQQQQQAHFTFDNYPTFDQANASPANSGKLFVGGLSHDTTDMSLKAYFDRFGALASAAVLRDNATMRSRGFGFVTFMDSNVAAHVVAAGQEGEHAIDGKVVDVKFAVPRCNTQSQQQCSLSTAKSAGMRSSGSFSSTTSSTPSVVNYNDVMQSTPKSTRSTHVDEFNLSRANSVKVPIPHISSSAGGDILRSRSFQNTTPPSPFSNSPKQAQDMLDYRRSSTTATNTTGTSSSFVDDSNVLVPNKVFVGGLLYATGHESLRKYFETFGQVDSAEVIYNRDTKKSRGFGFVIFTEFSSVEKVLQMQKTGRLMVDNKQVEVKLCKAREDTVAEFLNTNRLVQSKSLDAEMFHRMQHPNSTRSNSYQSHNAMNMNNQFQGPLTMQSPHNRSFTYSSPGQLSNNRRQKSASVYSMNNTFNPPQNNLFGRGGSMSMFDDYLGINGSNYVDDDDDLLDELNQPQLSPLARLNEESNIFDPEISSPIKPGPIGEQRGNFDGMNHKFRSLSMTVQPSDLFDTPDLDPFGLRRNSCYVDSPFHGKRGSIAGNMLPQITEHDDDPCTNLFFN